MYVFAITVLYCINSKGSDLMNINFNTFNKGVNKAGSVSNAGNIVKNESAPVAGGKIKSDVISISAGASDYSEIAKIRTSVAGGVNECGSSEKIASLRSAIANGSYNVSSEAVAGKILNRFI